MSKGKEVYARFSAALRAAAAEKGRVASREWAQKQKVKNMIAKVEDKVAKA
jgi:hypothetical protein